jgi:peptidase S46-like protein
MKLCRLLCTCALALPALADEGLWLFSQFPKDAFQQKYGLAATDALLDHLRLASVRIGSGSGAFVSARGLLVTNQRVAADCLAKRNALQDGFYAAAEAQEARCGSLDAHVLVAMENVTDKVKSAAAGVTKAAEALEKRNAAIAAIEKACGAKTGNSCAVVKLYSGERYDLYQYKKYNDLRLVFAPERAIAQFGGSPASLTYPRYALDIAFLRAYENGAPAATPQFLKWSAEGVKDAATVFAVGSPVSTARLSTVAQLNFYHDTMLPFALSRVQSRIADLRAFAAKSADNRRAAELTLASLGAEYKLLAGKLIGVGDATLIARKTNFERRLRNAVQHDPKLGTEGGKVWDEVAAAYKAWAPSEREYQVLAFPLTDAPDAGVKGVLEARYQEEVKALKDKQIDATKARLVKKHQETIEALETSAAERIAHYRYKIFGDADYPDATGTPRVTFGVVKPYRDRTEAPVPFATTFGGLYHLAMPQEPYKLPQRWVDGKPLLDLVMPMNFASTCDITSGASGPVVNTAGEMVGITFDGNLESIAVTYLYSDETARAVHVATQGIVEVLQKLYKTTALLNELGVPPAVHTPKSQ